VVNPGPIAVRGELDKDPTQVYLSKHHQVVDALPPNRTDQSFRKAVLPRRTGRDWLVANAHGAQAAGDNGTVYGVTVADQVAWGLGPSNCSRKSNLQIRRR
jgi:hypothetical protein